MVLLHCARNCTTLTQLKDLNLARNKFGDGGAIALAQSFSALSHLQQLNLARNEKRHASLLLGNLRVLLTSLRQLELRSGQRFEQ